MNKRMNLFALTWPIFIENVLFMLLGFIDIFVLSRYNDVAASAVSAANQIISICNLVFSIISGATAILISQSLGAQKRESASQIAALSLLFSTVIGLVISALIALFHRPLLAALGAQGEILEYGCEYLLIVGGFIFHTITAQLGHCHPAQPRTHPHLDVRHRHHEPAQCCAGHRFCAWSVWIAFAGRAWRCHCHHPCPCSRCCYPLCDAVPPCRAAVHLFRCCVLFPREEGQKILLVGLPSAFESINYNVAQLVVTGIIFAFYPTAILSPRPIFPTLSSSFMSFPIPSRRAHRFWSVITWATVSRTRQTASVCARCASHW